MDPDALEREIAAAERRYGDTLAGLQRPDGTPLYSPAEHQERELAARAAFHKDTAAVDARLDAAIQEAQAEIAAVQEADPTRDFSRDQLERIALRTTIVTEDLTYQPEPVQVGRQRAALASNDRAERYIALRAGRALLAKRDEGRDRGVTLRNGRPVPEAPDYSALGEVVRELEAGFLDGKRRERAEAQIAAAQAVGARLSEARYLARTYGPRGSRPATTARA